MNVVIPNEVLTATRMTEGEMKQEIAVMLFYWLKHSAMNWILVKLKRSLSSLQ
ncbi:hypothetical protein [Nostoc sp.]|uniref:hypothetical protein n=1 Tax=Nostoc sp. TaxID=1180 RepID=UPI002FF99FFD